MARNNHKPKVDVGEENGNQLQYSCLVNPMDKGAGWAKLPRVAKRLGHNLMTK